METENEFPPKFEDLDYTYGSYVQGRSFGQTQFKVHRTMGHARMSITHTAARWGRVGVAHRDWAIYEYTGGTWEPISWGRKDYPLPWHVSNG